MRRPTLPRAAALHAVATRQVTTPATDYVVLVVALLAVAVGPVALALTQVALLAADLAALAT